jgi:thiamine phosphate synthase YjbQ (UPF0047 family)
MSKRIVPVQLQSKDVTVVPQIETLVNDAMFIIGNELARYRQKTSRGITLDQKESRVVKDLIDSLVKLTKEARECSKSQDLSNLSVEDILALLGNKSIKTDEPKQDE